jgi:hypothetical protein
MSAYLEGCEPRRTAARGRKEHNKRGGANQRASRGLTS